MMMKARYLRAKENSDPPRPAEAQQVIAGLIVSIERIWMGYEEDKIYSTCTLLDPRFKEVCFTSSALVIELRDWCMQIQFVAVKVLWLILKLKMIRKEITGKLKEVEVLYSVLATLRKLMRELWSDKLPLLGEWTLEGKCLDCFVYNNIVFILCDWICLPHSLTCMTLKNHNLVFK